MSEKKMSEKYTLIPDFLSRHAFYEAADGVSLRECEYKCQTRLIWIRRKTGEEGTRQDLDLRAVIGMKH